jgi:hypothetical protein
MTQVEVRSTFNEKVKRGMFERYALEKDKVLDGCWVRLRGTKTSGSDRRTGPSPRTSGRPPGGGRSWISRSREKVGGDHHLRHPGRHPGSRRQ